MKTVLFRGKAKLGGKWEYGTPVVSVHGVRMAREFILHLECGHFAALGQKLDNFMGPIDPETVGQWTGLRDKNGVKIFEGDIVKCQSSIMTPSISKVKGAVENSLILAYPDEEKYSVPFSWQFSEPDIAEVIGNVFDNPDLLKYEEEQNEEEQNAPEQNGEEQDEEE